MKHFNTLKSSKEIIQSIYAVLEEQQLYLDKNFCAESLASLCECTLEELDDITLEEFGLSASGIISMYREQHC